MKRRNFFSLPLVFFSSLLLTISCNQAPQQTPNASSSLSNTTPIVIGYSNWAGWWTWAIAEEEGLFAKNGANVQMKWFDGYLEPLQALAAGQLDGNSQTLNDTIAFAGDAVNGQVAVLVNDNSSGNDKVIVTEEIKTIQDLKGKKVAVEEGVVGGTLKTQTLTNKTLTSPTITNPNISGAGVDASIVFEGATADAHETTLTVVDPTQDNTITLPNTTGTVVIADATQTLTNKTLTSPTISGSPVITGLSSAGMVSSSATPKDYVDSILGSATAAATSAASAATSAASAATSASSASTSASSALTSANSASTSATAAATSAASAATSATAAATSATSAAASATTAANSVAAIASYATTASNSAAAAATSATSAAT